jgi:hypothetical protein
VNSSNNSSILEVPVGYYLMDSLFTSSLMSDVGGYGDFPMENVGVEGEINSNIAGTNVVGNVGTVTNNISGSNINQQAGGMTQFERDINIAIQNSLDEERRKLEESNINKNDKNVEMTPVEEINEEDELEQAKLLSMQEHEKVVEKENEEDDRLKDELLENQDFIKDILKGIGNTDIKDDEVQEVLKKIKEDKNDLDKNSKEKKNDKDSK